MRMLRVAGPLRTAVRLVLALTCVVGSAVLLSSSERRAFTATDRAFYADANLINFVRPGLVVKIVTASIADDGTVKVRFKLTDPQGLPLDKDGVTTPGSISSSLRFVIGYIPQGQRQYKSYIIRNVTSPITNQTATQANSDSTGTYETVADGEYVYTFKNKVPTDFDRHVTHSIGMWAGRDLSEFDLASIRNYDSDVYTWVPDGSAVTVTRDVIRTASCEKCHDPLQAHDERRGIELCVICHQPQSSDPDTGNSVNLPVMIHKIHMGSQLPSVLAGGKYQIIGFQQAVSDFSTVVFPSDPRNCTACHEQDSGAAQANAYLKPNRAACGACHDNVNFATGQGHLDLPQISDNECASCHIPQGELDFDASIIGAHMIPRFSASLPGVVFDILSVTGAGPGLKPTVTFTVKDKSGNNLDITKMQLQLVMGGPTTDYASSVSENVTKATGAGGTYTWTMANALPANATGTYAVGIEGYNSVTLLPDTTIAQTVRDAGANVVKYFSVDGSPVQARRQVVSLDKCNKCHSSLSVHGDNRNRIEQCVICHNPNGTDVANRPANKLPAQTIQFAYMIHRIHTGADSTAEYTIYGYRASVNDFTDVRFPGDRRDCAVCHVNGAKQLPLPDGLLNVTSPRGLLNPMGPATAACTGCHTSVAAASHALSNTTQLGEACAACHATNREFSVPKIHAR